ncbi:metallophosphoesterase family protein [Skermanella pratensis]|uniref:metallophosphoesterase family protein n=1 Tax=Skermanella pratensis TaxID=2233999 RepID=UPI001301988E|nr:metallophosphoesterase [Skermanella pratensis]
MRRLAHISDLHFGRIDESVVEALLTDLAEVRPDLIVVSGDLTQRGHHDQFQAARAFLQRLESPYLVVPGNHDIPGINLLARFAAPLRRYRRYIERDLRPLHRDAEIAVLGLNTARPVGLHWNWSHGRINAEQIAHARQVFDTVEPDVFKVVVTHHPFLPPPDAPETRLVGRASLALRTFEACGVDLLLAGHLHRGYHGDVRTHHTAVKRSILVAQASTATSTRLRNEPNAYNLIEVDGDRIGFGVRVWDGTGFRHGAAGRFVRRHGHWERA